MKRMLAVLCLSCLGWNAQATVVQVGSRAGFDALGYIPVDWGVFGPNGTAIITPASRVVDGLTIGIATSFVSLTRVDEGSGFVGDFTLGDHLLTDSGTESDSFIVSFGKPVRGFGTQIEPHYITGQYSGEVYVYSPSNTLLFTADYSGDATTAEDNSAPFVGVISSSADIGYAAFTVNQSGMSLPSQSGAVVINRLDVLRVPEPGGVAVITGGLVALGVMRMRRPKPRP